MDITTVSITAILALLREARREHGCAIDKQNCLRSAMIEGDDPTDYPCTCGADAWNARIEALLYDGP